MKTVLLAVNSKYIHSALSVWLIAAGVEKFARFRHDICVVEATVHHEVREIAGMVAELEPDVVGISVYIWNVSILPELLQILRNRLPNVIIVLGGPEAEFNTEYWLSQGTEAVLAGEGEHTFPAFLDGLVEKLAPAPYSHENGFIDPYTETYLKTLKGKLAYLETSRGCPFRCEFCLSGGKVEQKQNYNGGVKFFPMELVKSQILKLINTEARTIKLVDRTFNCDIVRAYEIFEYILSLDTEICFHFEVRPDLFDERTLLLLADAPAGRIQFEMGVQSFHKPALDAVSVNIDVQKAEHNIAKLLEKGNIHLHLGLIAGLPYERLSDFQDSFDSAFNLGAHTLQLGFLKLLYGSALRSKADSLGIEYSRMPPYMIKNSPWMSEDDFAVLKKTENALQHTYNKQRFMRTLKYVLEAADIRPFSLFLALGEAVPNHGMQLETYAGHIYEFFAKLPGIDENDLCDTMICDWLTMVKGKNMPSALKKSGFKPGADILSDVEKKLGHKPSRGEAAVLHSGEVVFVDSTKRNPVTGLYQLGFRELFAGRCV